MSLVLLVEDNSEIMEINAIALKRYGYNILQAGTVEQALRLLSVHTPDIIVLDIMLPDGNGLDLCRKLKKERDIPILFLSALGANKDMIEGLRAGGNDYLVKPYPLDVLAARIEVQLRQSRQREAAFTFGDLRFDLISASAFCNGQDMGLTQKEFALLHLLAVCGKRQEPVPKEKLYETAWGQPLKNDSRALWTAVSRLKGKLADCKSAFVINYSRADGYILERD